MPGVVRRCPFMGEDRKPPAEGQNDAFDPKRASTRMLIAMARAIKDLTRIVRHAVAALQKSYDRFAAEGGCVEGWQPFQDRDHGVVGTGNGFVPGETMSPRICARRCQNAVFALKYSYLTHHSPATNRKIMAIPQLAIILDCNHTGPRLKHRQSCADTENVD